MSATRLTKSEPFVDKEDVAQFLAVSTRTVERLVRNGIIPCYRPLGPSGPVRFRLSDIEKAMRRAMQFGRRNNTRTD